MRWRTKPLTPITRRPYTDTIFAWTPKKCEDGYTRWLCFVEVTKEEWEPALEQFMIVRYNEAPPYFLSDP